MSRHQLKTFGDGDDIFHEGDVGDCAYLIERGRILVYIEKDDAEFPLKLLGEGEVFGEMALIDDSLRSASCRAVGECQLIVITQDQLLDRIRVTDPVVRLLMQALLERLRSQNDIIRGNPPIEPSKIDPLAYEKKEALERISLENRIATALDNDEFTPFYQPIYDLVTGEIKGCEALVRWISPDGTVISPAAFMDVMEESALILRAGRVVIEKATADLPKMRSLFHGNQDFFVSVNVSGRQFSDPNFMSHLEQTRIRHGMEAKQIKLELTERILTEGPQAQFTLKKCRSLGYQLAIDDFGTGFSSLQYLAQMPITDLKIDRSFIMKMLTDDKTLSIIKSLIYLADRLGMKLIAEGIETEEQLQALRVLNVNMGQGYLFAKPVPLVDFLKLAPKFSSSKAA